MITKLVDKQTSIHGCDLTTTYTSYTDAGIAER